MRRPGSAHATAGVAARQNALLLRSANLPCSRPDLCIAGPGLRVAGPACISPAPTRLRRP